MVKDAVICGHDGAIWAKSKDFEPTPAELKVNHYYQLSVEKDHHRMFKMCVLANQALQLIFL